MHVGVTGTRHGATKVQLAYLEKRLITLHKENLITGNEITLHHGCCKGADTQARKLAYRLHYIIEGHPSTLQTDFDCLGCHVLHDAKAPLERNKDIVHAVSILFVLPHTREEKLRSGTWMTYQYATQHKHVVIDVIYP